LRFLSLDEFQLCLFFSWYTVPTPFFAAFVGFGDSPERTVRDYVLPDYFEIFFFRLFLVHWFGSLIALGWIFFRSLFFSFSSCSSKD